MMVDGARLMAMLDDISTLREGACKQILAAAKARLRAIRIADPMMYGIKRVGPGVPRYRTTVPEMLATDLNHSGLWLTTSREWAELYVEQYHKGFKGFVFEVFEIPKTEVAKLPCARRYARW